MISFLNQIKRRKNKKKAFTLLEMLLAMTIFLIIIGTVSSLFISGIKQQAVFLANQEILNEVTYALEFISRALRMAGKELNDPPLCLSSTGLNYENYINESGIRFINSLEGDDCQAFYLENEQLKYRKDLDNPSSPPALDLTSNKLKINSLKFILSGQESTDKVQPRVTVYLEVENKNMGSNSPKLKIQTTISQRKLDI